MTYQLLSMDLIFSTITKYLYLNLISIFGIIKKSADDVKNIIVSLTYLFKELRKI